MPRQPQRSYQGDSDVIKKLKIKINNQSHYLHTLRLNVYIYICPSDESLQPYSSPTLIPSFLCVPETPLPWASRPGESIAGSSAGWVCSVLYVALPTPPHSCLHSHGNLQGGNHVQAVLWHRCPVTGCIWTVCARKCQRAWLLACLLACEKEVAACNHVYNCPVSCGHHCHYLISWISFLLQFTWERYHIVSLLGPTHRCVCVWALRGVRLQEVPDVNTHVNYYFYYYY